MTRLAGQYESKPVNPLSQYTIMARESLVLRLMRDNVTIQTVHPTTGVDFLYLAPEKGIDTRTLRIMREGSFSDTEALRFGEAFRRALKELHNFDASSEWLPKRDEVDGHEILSFTWTITTIKL